MRWSDGDMKRAEDRSRRGVRSYGVSREAGSAGVENLGFRDRIPSSIQNVPLEQVSTLVLIKPEPVQDSVDLSEPENRALKEQNPKRISPVEISTDIFPASNNLLKRQGTASTVASSAVPVSSLAGSSIRPSTISPAPSVRSSTAFSVAPSTLTSARSGPISSRTLVSSSSSSSSSSNITNSSSSVRSIGSGNTAIPGTSNTTSKHRGPSPAVIGVIAAVGTLVLLLVLWRIIVCARRRKKSNYSEPSPSHLTSLRKEPSFYAYRPQGAQSVLHAPLLHPGHMHTYSAQSSASMDLDSQVPESGHTTPGEDDKLTDRPRQMSLPVSAFQTSYTSDIPLASPVGPLPSDLNVFDVADFEPHSRSYTPSIRSNRSNISTRPSFMSLDAPRERIRGPPHLAHNRATILGTINVGSPQSFQSGFERHSVDLSRLRSHSAQRVRTPSLVLDDL